MRLAFDPDNTFICCSHNFPLEKSQRSIWTKLLGNEQLRHGIKNLTDYCRQHGWEVWVYTTLDRCAWRIRRLFWPQGIRLDGGVN